MIDKETIAELLDQTRDARLILEMAAWIHDLDKASWPFLLYGPFNALKIKKSKS